MDSSAASFREAAAGSGKPFAQAEFRAAQSRAWGNDYVACAWIVIAESAFKIGSLHGVRAEDASRDRAGYRTGGAASIDDAFHPHPKLHLLRRHHHFPRLYSRPGNRHTLPPQNRRGFYKPGRSRRTVARMNQPNHGVKIEVIQGAQSPAPDRPGFAPIAIKTTAFTGLTANARKLTLQFGIPPRVRQNAGN